MTKVTLRSTDHTTNGKNFVTSKLPYTNFLLKSHLATDPYADNSITIPEATYKKVRVNHSFKNSSSLFFGYNSEQVIKGIYDVLLCI